MTDERQMPKKDQENIKEFYIEIAKIAARLDPNANSTPLGRQAVISNVLKIYELVIES